jgi:hypothetical protein
VSAQSVTISDTQASLVVVDPGGLDSFSGNLTGSGAKLVQDSSGALMGRPTTGRGADRALLGHTSGA